MIDGYTERTLERIAIALDALVVAYVVSHELDADELNKAYADLVSKGFLDPVVGD